VSSTFSCAPRAGASSMNSPAGRATTRCTARALRRALWEQDRGFLHCLPAAVDALLVPRNLDTVRWPRRCIRRTFACHGVRTALRSGDTQAGARHSGPFDQSLDNANLVVVAPAGPGKSFSCKLLALAAAGEWNSFIRSGPRRRIPSCRRSGWADGDPIGRLVFGIASPFRSAGSDGDRWSVAHRLQDEEDPLAERVTALSDYSRSSLALGRGLTAPPLVGYP